MPDDSQTQTNDVTAARPDADNRRINTRLAEVLARYPGRYSDEQATMIRERIAATVDVARTVRRIPLTNGDGF